MKPTRTQKKEIEKRYSSNSSRSVNIGNEQTKRHVINHNSNNITDDQHVAAGKVAVVSRGERQKQEVGDNERHEQEQKQLRDLESVMSNLQHLNDKHNKSVSITKRNISRLQNCNSSISSNNTHEDGMESSSSSSSYYSETDSRSTATISFGNQQMQMVTKGNHDTTTQSQQQKPETTDVYRERQILLLMLLAQVCSLHDATPKTFTVHV
eukprot:CAMPEP_0194371586 /NCGR_PEP_ID=MMETSP0174-20130528/20007_1 /TAXON_ID=216777 /ORGANISM="Proboscia alata, Strain PI-D3" /LENGTH=209 /DNA_ID=CAMNT_0039149743 /DNA_START=309 /DNA_END=934 /DNA_ORIENTATION=+